MKKHFEIPFNIDELSVALHDDFVKAGDAVYNDPCQYNNRVFFMVSFSMIEAMINSLKQAALYIHENYSMKIYDYKADIIYPKLWDTFETRITNEEVLILKEETPNVKKNGEVSTRPSFLPTEISLKLSFHLFSKVINLDYRLNYSDSSYIKLRKSIKVRNRIVHPKDASSLEITDRETADLSIGFNWFYSHFDNITNECQTILNILNE